MKMIIEFGTDNASFCFDEEGQLEGNPEIKRILAYIGESLPFPDGHKVIKDANGNTIGQAYFKK